MMGCRQQGAQRPSTRINGTRKAPEPDSTHLALMELNQQLALTADNELRQIIKEQKENYALYNNGTWVLIVDPGQTSMPMLKADEECLLKMRISSLTGRLYQDREETIKIGKADLPIAIGANIYEWHRGVKVHMYAPWYAAYGVIGKDSIPPYENVIIDLELK